LAGPSQAASKVPGCDIACESWTRQTRS
jgi:hypothetical protein